MNDLMVVFSDILPTEHIVNEIKKAIAVWENDPTDDKVKGICIWSTMLATKHITSQTEGGATKVMQELDELVKMRNLIKRTDS